MVEEPIKKMKGAVDEFSKIIPEIFFDIICRVAPGIIFVTVFIVAIPINLTGKWYYDLPVIVVVAYSIGLSLDCFSNWLWHPRSMRWSWGALEEHATTLDLDNLDKFVKTEESNISDKKKRRIILESLRSQYKIENHSEKAVLIKILAEERFFKVMALGLPISVGIFLLNKFYSDCSEALKDWFIAILLLVAVEIVFFICIYDRMRRAVTRTFIWWKHKGR